MFLKKKTMKSTEICSDKISAFKNILHNADAVVIGAGAGLSTAAGLTYSGVRFEKYFADFHEKYGITDMYTGGFYPFASLEEYWGWWSRHIWWNRYEAEINDTYSLLYNLVEDKDYFVITTNVDHQFQLNGFDKKRLFYMQGDYGLLQCSRGCHQKTYDNKETVSKMMETQTNMKVPTELVPTCPVCGAPMVTNLRCDSTFVQDEGWYEAKSRYEDFISRNKKGKVVYLELGVGDNTPIWIKYPFQSMTLKNPEAVYICINNEKVKIPVQISGRTININGDIREVLKKTESRDE